MNLKIYAATILPLIQVLTGCAVNTGVVKMDNERYFVTKQAATGFSGIGTLTVDALKEANDFCTSNRLKTYIEKIEESKPPYVAGNFPRTSIVFKCLELQPYPSIQPLTSQKNRAIQDKCIDLGFERGSEMFKTCVDKSSKAAQE